MTHFHLIESVAQSVKTLHLVPYLLKSGTESVKHKGTKKHESSRKARR